MCTIPIDIYKDVFSIYIVYYIDTLYTVVDVYIYSTLILYVQLRCFNLSNHQDHGRGHGSFVIERSPGREFAECFNRSGWSMIHNDSRLLRYIFVCTENDTYL